MVLVSKRDQRLILLAAFRRRLRATAAHRELCEAFGDEAVSVRTCQSWFRRFRAGDFCLQDRPRRGRPSEIEDDELVQAVEAEPLASGRALGRRLGFSHTQILRRLKALGFQKQPGGEGWSLTT